MENEIRRLEEGVEFSTSSSLNKMQFIVLNEETATEFKHEMYHVVISIYSPSRSPISFVKCDKRLGVLYLCFHDADNKIESIPELVLFNKGMAIDVLTYIESIKDRIELIVVNCEAGISRSMGLCAALSKIYTGKDEYYFRQGLPNMLVYKTILEEATKAGIL